MVTAQKKLHSTNREPPKIKVSQTKIDSIIEAGQKQLRLPGVSIAIMQGNKIIFSKGYGVADLQTKVPATSYTIYPIASLSKHFTAAAIMKLVEQKHLKLDDPVAKYLPDYSSTKKPILTLRHLLYQTSGLPTWDDLPEMQGVNTGKAEDFTLKKVVEAVSRHTSAYPAGYWWSYSNSNYSILAAIIEKVTGKSYDKYLREQFFIPLHLSSTGSCQLEEDIPAGPKSTGYLAVKDSFELRPLSDIASTAFTGGGGLCSNATDLVSWMRALVDGKAIKSSSFKKMTTAAAVNAGFTPPYGFGLSLRTLEGQAAIWHKGVIAGYTSLLAYFPKQDIIIATLVNGTHVALQTIVKRVVRNLLNIPEPAFNNFAIPEKEVKRITSNYNDGMFRFSISAEAGKLFINVPDLGGSYQLFYQGNKEFATAEPGMIRLRMVHSNKNTDWLEWDWAEIRAYAWREQKVKE